jgi:predicted O-linked N-acetylglucosamine transferase (SPINDLY family)
MQYGADLTDALARHRAGDAAAAEPVYRRICGSDPDRADAAFLLGMLCLGQGRLVEARDLLERARRLAPADAGVLNALGGLHHASGDMEAAAEAFAAAGSHYNLGLARHAQGRLDEAIAAWQRAEARDPADPRIPGNLGAALREAGRPAEAEQACRRALALAPGDSGAHGNLGLALFDLGRLDEAVAAHLRATSLDPGASRGHANLGLALEASGRVAEACEAYRRAIALDPDFAPTYSDLGSALTADNRFAEAIDVLGRAVALDPRYVDAHANLAIAQAALGRQTEAMDCYETALALDPGNPRLWKNLLACAPYRDDLDGDAFAELHRRYGRALAARPAPLPAIDRDPNRRLRIGYLTSDMRDHPVADIMLPVFRRHDRSALALHFYPHLFKPDAVTEAVRGLADGWTPINGMSDAQAAERIRADGIDVLVCLAARFDHNRPGICAHRPAPVQISLHDVATSGLTEMDYIIADPFLAPRGGREWFSERVLRLPHFYLAELPAGLPPVTRHPAAEPAVFACFNNPTKITGAILALWGRILAVRPEARLVLGYQGAYLCDRQRSRCLQGLIAAGARADQVTFLTDRVNNLAFLLRHQGVDATLDTAPFTGSTTTFRSLAMGVPVVTLPTERMVGRWSLSMLHALGLDELIAATPDDYVAIAATLAADVSAWRNRRGEIRDRLAASPLCDPRRWTRNLERLYRAVWRRYCRG